MSFTSEKTMVLVDCIHGDNAPLVWAKKYCFYPEAWNVTKEEMDILLAGPSHEYYDEVWQDVLAKAEFMASDGELWHLWQDGDVFAYTGEGEQWL